MQKLSI